MKECLLLRLDYKTRYGTFGVLLIEEELFCYTLEVPSLYNIRNLSCIPTGRYRCAYHIGGTKKGYLLQDVRDRSGIMIHAGNTIEDSEGCILLGSRRIDRHRLGDSRVAVAQFEALLFKKDFNLTIKEYSQ